MDETQKFVEQIAALATEVTELETPSATRPQAQPKNRGTVCWVSDRGYGYIAPHKPNRRDVFFHFSQLYKPGTISKTLNAKVGDQVEYEVVEATKGPAARNIKLLT